MSTWLWDELHEFFDTDDGSLPEVHMNYSDPHAVVRGFALLQDRSLETMHEDQRFWSKADEEALPVNSVPNAAALVVSGEAEAFHVVMDDIRCGDVTLPDLGVFVFDDQICLDFRMGAHWGPVELGGFFGLLADLAALDPEASLSLEDYVLLEVVERFRGAFERFVRERTPGGVVGRRRPGVESDEGVAGGCDEV